ncbi:hypothetical protein WUBG_09248, partial [Wuchereria bancrofti]
MYARSQRAETRNRAKDELKRVINSVDKVRKWEKKWIVVKDTQIKLFRWVPGKFIKMFNIIGVKRLGS